MFRFTSGYDFSCPFCPDQKEDEIHVLCVCTEYDIKPDFLRCESFRMRNMYRSVLSTSDSFSFFLFFRSRLLCFLLGQGNWDSQSTDFRELQKIKNVHPVCIGFGMIVCRIIFISYTMIRKLSSSLYLCASSEYDITRCMWNIKHSMSVRGVHVLC